MDKNIKFDFDDILIKPAKISNIDSRKEINPYSFLNYLPIITAPMDSSINAENRLLFSALGIVPCLPRGEKFNGFGFASYSLTEMEVKYDNGDIQDNEMCLIDIANGNMRKLVMLTKALKKKYPKMILMVGNVANPETYKELSNAGADYIRCGIGGGAGCTTSANVSIGYGMGSLISDIYVVSTTLDKPAKIVADGGMKNYSDVIKALALGADYVMIGSLFTKAIESCGDNYLFKYIRVPQCIAEFCFGVGLPIYKKYRGMSTKEVQKKWGKEKLTTSEGVTRKFKVEYKLGTWVENFEDYLRSAMSYCNAENLDKFIGNVDIVRITDNAYNRFKK